MSWQYWWWCKKLLKAIFINESGENYPKDAFHMYAENEPAAKKNETYVNDLPGDIFHNITKFQIIVYTQQH